MPPRRSTRSRDSPPEVHYDSDDDMPLAVRKPRSGKITLKYDEDSDDNHDSDSDASQESEPVRRASTRTTRGSSKVTSAKERKGRAYADAQSQTRCTKCDTRFHMRTWLQCASCGDWHHPPCLTPPLDKAKLGKYAECWQCENCKVCFKCEEEGDASQLLFCDICDRAFHTTCCDPPVETIPKGSWECHDCHVKFASEIAVTKKEEVKQTEKEKGPGAGSVFFPPFTDCADCGASLEEPTWLHCTTCLAWYHPTCTDPPLDKEKMGKFADNWQCSVCKACSVCLEDVEERKLMFCDCCDRAFHTYCLNPPMRRVPDGSWMCYDCEDKSDLQQVEDMEKEEKAAPKSAKKGRPAKKTMTVESEEDEPEDKMDAEEPSKAEETKQEEKQEEKPEEKQEEKQQSDPMVGVQQASQEI